MGKSFWRLELSFGNFIFCGPSSLSPPPVSRKNHSFCFRPPGGVFSREEIPTSNTVFFFSSPFIPMPLFFFVLCLTSRTSSYVALQASPGFKKVQLEDSVRRGTLFPPGVPSRASTDNSLHYSHGSIVVQIEQPGKEGVLGRVVRNFWPVGSFPSVS